MPGPPPKHPSVRVRRNDPKKDFRVLSADGRQGDPPPWPLQPDITMQAELEFARDRIVSLQVELDAEEDGRARGRIKRALDKQEMAATLLGLKIEQATDLEVALWNELWSFPQAVLWEENRSHRTVAGYVRWKIREEQGDIRAEVAATKLSDRLGLNDLALMRLRAEIERADEAEDKGERRRSKPTPKKPGRKKPPDDPRNILSVVS